MYSLEDLADVCTPLAQIDLLDGFRIAKLTPIMELRPSLDAHAFVDVPYAQMSVHACPLHANAYQISLYLSDPHVPLMAASPSFRERGAVFRFRCTIFGAARGDFKWESVSALATLPHMLYRGFSYSGHALEGPDSDLHDHPFRAPHAIAKSAVVIPGERRFVRDLSTYASMVARVAHTHTQSSVYLSFYG
jgi:hypothetical protein